MSLMANSGCKWAIPFLYAERGGGGWAEKWGDD